MPYITSIEEIGMVKYSQESIITVLETRFKNVPTNIVDAVN